MCSCLGLTMRGWFWLPGQLGNEKFVYFRIMQAAFDISLEYSQTREQFNKKIGEFQLVQGKLSEIFSKMQASRGYLYSLARGVDEGRISNTVLSLITQGLCLSYSLHLRKCHPSRLRFNPNIRRKWLHQRIPNRKIPKRRQTLRDRGWHE